MKRRAALAARLRRHGPLLAVLLVAALWSGALAAMHLAGRASPLDRLEAVTQDWRYLLRGPRPAPADVVVVAVDEAALRHYGEFPIPRRALAEAVVRLRRAGAAAVALDVLFLEPDEAAGDAALAAALGSMPSAIAAAGLFRRGTPPERPPEARGADVPPRQRLAFRAAPPAARDFLWPRDRFAENAVVGAVNLSTDGGGTPRHVPLLVGAGGRMVPSLPLAAAALGAGGGVSIDATAVTVAGDPVPLDLGRHLALGYYGPAGAIETLPILDVLAGRVPRARIAGRVAVLGTTAVGSGDTFATPFDPVMPGVEVMATAVANFLGNGGLDRGPWVRRVDAAVAVGLALAAVLVLSWRRTALGYVVLAGLLAAWAAGTVIAFDRGVWLSATLAPAAAVPPAALFVAASILAERRLSRAAGRARDALAKLHSPILAERLAADPDYLATPETRVTAVLFFDVAGFTALAERVGAERARRFQNALLDAVDAAALPEGGETMAFLGDGAMLVFGLPEPAGDEAARALRALSALAAAHEAMLARWRARVDGPLGMRYGLNFGPVVVSRIGTARQATVTLTGDTINVAARLMEIAKASGAAIAVAESVFEALGPAEAELAEGFGAPREVTVRGRAAALVVRLAGAEGAAGNARSAGQIRAGVP